VIAIWILVAALAVGSAIFVVVVDNPVHSALGLVLTLLCVAAMYAMLNAPFVAIIQVAVYAGAIMVLFLFVIMLLNVGREEGAGRAEPASWWSAIVFAVVLLLGLGSVLAPMPRHPAVTLTNPYLFGSPQQIGSALFRNIAQPSFVIPFEAVSLLLTVAMVGAILLARRKA
jgi:NADH-quinone oxidoreductase subunit J